MPAKDPASGAHHLRIGSYSSDLVEAVKGFKGWVCVSHQGGKTGEHPHIHCFIQHEKPCTFMTVKNRVWKLDAFKDLKGNASFSQRPHDNIEAWWSYVWRDEYRTKRPELVCWNLDIPMFGIPKPVDLILSPTAVITLKDTPVTKERVVAVTKKATVTALDKQNRFLSYCRQYYAEFPDDEISERNVVKLLYAYCRDNGFITEFAAFQYVNYVVSNLLKGEAYEHSRSRFVDRLCVKFF